ncbi:cysteine-rich receptor-like protein kinase 25 [Neltuma alba]|uniref:cysteine-rich receptor-like protein kinase 25 n=1 Tax=Neltuma alba TaxID=207710 RepID=UPI0010A4835A|nr:cysteine-rich receptor-like protein kinase 25 [Prosopis alba]
MFGIYQNPDFFYAVNNPSDVADADQCTLALDRLMQDLNTKAAAGGPNSKVADGKASMPFQYVHGLTQCTPDLTEQNCEACLKKVISDIPFCCQNKVGGRVIKRNCNLRFEKNRFYNPNAVDTIQVSSSPPPSCTTTPSQGPAVSPNIPSTREGT